MSGTLLLYRPEVCLYQIAEAEKALKARQEEMIQTVDALHNAEHALEALRSQSVDDAKGLANGDAASDHHEAAAQLESLRHEYQQVICLSAMHQ